MMLVNLAGQASIFNHAVEAYKKNYRAYGHDEKTMKFGITNLFHTQETDEKAFKNFYQYLNQGFLYSNGHPMSKESYVDALDTRNVLLVGNPQTIIDKMLYQYDLYGHHRSLLQLDIGGMPFEEVKRNIEVIAKEIAPVVKKEIAKRKLASQ